MSGVTYSILLGIVQGISEWFPISSSAHLLLAEQILGLSVSSLFNTMLHVATIIVILLVFRKDAKLIIKSLLKREFSSPHGKLALLVLIGTIPTAITGYLTATLIASVSNLFIGLFLLVTGIVVFISKFGKGLSSLDYKRSLFIGALQGFSAVPGISRSGITIGSGIFSGIRGEDAVRFSFLLSIPAIIGAAIFEAGKTGIASMDVASLMAGMSSAIIVGYPCLRLLIKIVMKKKFHLFSFYCWVVGAILVMTSLLS